MEKHRKLVLAGVALAVGVSLLALGAFVVPAVGLRVLSERAQQRGFRLETPRAHVTWSGLQLDNVKVEARTSGHVIAQLEAVTVGWSSVIGSRKLTVSGVKVDATGSIDDLKKTLRGRPRAEGSGEARASSAVELSVRGIDVTWWRENGSPPRCEARGGALSADAAGTKELRFSELRCREGRKTALLRDVRLRADLDPSQKEESKIGASRDAGEPLGAGLRERLVLEAKSVNLELAIGVLDDSVGKPGDEPSRAGGTSIAAAQAAQSSKSAEREPLRGDVHEKDARPLDKADARKRDLGASRESRAQAADVQQKRDSASGQVESSSDSALAAARRILTFSDPSLQQMATRMAEGSGFLIHEVRVRLQGASEKLDLGPWKLSGAWENRRFDVSLSDEKAKENGALAAKWELYADEARSKIELALPSTALNQLGISERDWGLLGVDQTRILVSATATVDAKRADIDFVSKGALKGLSFRQPWLAANVVSGLDLEWQSELSFDAEHRKVAVSSLNLSIGNISSRMRGLIELEDSLRRLELELEVPAKPCSDYLSAIPHGLAPLLDGWQLPGQLGLLARISFDRKNMDASKVGLRLDNRCHVASTPPQVSPSRFTRPFVLELDDEAGVPKSMTFGPGSWNWTPLAEMSPYLESAVLVCEDGRFLRHSGIDIEAIENSIRDNLRSGRFARGGSTVSMQLAKNLYLRRDKTLSRKLQEAALTMLLEQSFAKRELLELYLNVIEFGPGIYGIREAARHHFDTTPDRLTLAQSYFLIALLPNPKVSYFGADGLVTKGRLAQLHQLMRIAAKRNHITQSELDAGLSEQLAFRVPGNQTVVPSRRITGDMPMDEPENDVASREVSP